jgi:inositol hexakisphosphate/diphosphoinositol-pentakisphosphate kinase
LLDPQHPSYTTPHASRVSLDGHSSEFLNKNLPEQNQQNFEPVPLKLIVRKDLLDDSNAAKDLMDDVKKRLKILLRPGESEKRPELTWPKSMKKEPVEVVTVSLTFFPSRSSSPCKQQEVIELLSSFRDIMRHNYETLDVDKIQDRW